MYMTGLGMNGVQNYGMYNVFSNYRAGGNLASTWEHFVMSLDNYLICEDADATYTGAYFDLSKVASNARLWMLSTSGLRYTRSKMS